MMSHSFESAVPVNNGVVKQTSVSVNELKVNTVVYTGVSNRSELVSRKMRQAADSLRTKLTNKTTVYSLTC